MRFPWPTLPNVVGVIDGTSIEIYIPKVEPQRLYYSGHYLFHAIHAQIVVYCFGKIRFVKCGFRTPKRCTAIYSDAGNRIGKELNKR